MVQLSKSISAKLAKSQSTGGGASGAQKEMSEDEERRFKQYLLSLGIADPVTREAHRDKETYYAELAKELSAVLLKPIQVSPCPPTFTAPLPVSTVSPVSQCTARHFQLRITAPGFMGCELVKLAGLTASHQCARRVRELKAKS